VTDSLEVFPTGDINHLELPSGEVLGGM